MEKLIFDFRVKLYNLLYKIFKLQKINEHYHGIIEKYITKKIPNSIRTCNISKSNENMNVAKNIWIFWWQGIENAPEVVKICVERIKKLNNNCKIIILSKDNYDEYVNLNENIINKFKNKKIGIAHFSDIVRVNLLAKYGGLWMDATMYETLEIPEEIFNLNFWSIKSNNRKTKFVSKNRWTTYCIYMKKNNILANFLVNAFNEYYEKNDKVCHYLFFDYLIDIAYNESKDIKEMIDNCPINNNECENLRKHLNEKNNDFIQKMLENNTETFLFKLTYKMEFSDDVDTVYNTQIRKEK